jgi:hypothetical protein
MKNGEAPPHPKTQAMKVRWEWRPRFEVRVVAATFAAL